jgi:hypothetical protein
MQQNPAEALREIEQLRSRTHRQINHFSFPLMLFGALMVVDAAIGMAFGGLAAGLFWVVAGPGGGAATGIYYHRRESKLGVETNPMPIIATAVAMMVGCFAAGFGGAALDLPVLSTLGPMFCISAGYLMFGRLVDSMSLQMSAVFLAIVVLLMWLFGSPEQTAGIGTGLYGAVTFVIGLFNRRNEVKVA